MVISFTEIVPASLRPAAPSEPPLFAAAAVAGCATLSLTAAAAAAEPFSTGLALESSPGAAAEAVEAPLGELPPHAASAASARLRSMSGSSFCAMSSVMTRSDGLSASSSAADGLVMTPSPCKRGFVSSGANAALCTATGPCQHVT